MLGYLSSMDHITFFTTKKIHRSRWASFNWVSKEIRNCFDFASLSYWSKTLTPSPQPVGCKSKTIARVFPRFTQFSYFIAELAERSPIIIQNSSNPSSRKNLDVQPYDRTTVQGATFNMRGQLYRGHANATALFSSPVVSALGSESDDPGSSPGRGKALYPWDVREKRCELRF